MYPSSLSYQSHAYSLTAKMTGGLLDSSPLAAAKATPLLPPTAHYAPGHALATDNVQRVYQAFRSSLPCIGVSSVATEKSRGAALDLETDVRVGLDRIITTFLQTHQYLKEKVYIALVEIRGRREAQVVDFTEAQKVLPELKKKNARHFNYHDVKEFPLKTPSIPSSYGALKKEIDAYLRDKKIETVAPLPSTRARVGIKNLPLRP